MAKQNSTNHALSWFIVQINGLRNQIPHANFTNVEFLRDANDLLKEILLIDPEPYLLSYHNADGHTIDQILDRIKKETQKVRLLIRRAALNMLDQSRDLDLLNQIYISLQSLSILLSQLNNELNSDYYLPLFAYSYKESNDRS